VASISRKWLQIGATLAILLVILNIALTLYNAVQLRRHSEMVTATYELQTQLSKLILLAVDAETGQRGFLLTGKEEYLAPYQNALSSVGDQLDRVSRLVDDDELQVVRMQQLRERLDDRLQILDKSIESRREIGFDLAHAIQVAGLGKPEMDSIRQLVDEMLSEEVQLLQRHSLNTSATYWTSLITGIISGLAALTAIASYLNFSRMYLNDREVYVKDLAERSEQLRTTLASIGDAVITTDAEGVITHMNAVAEELLKWPSADAIGHSIDATIRLCNEVTRDPTSNPAHAALTTGTVAPLDNQTVLVRSDSTECPIDGSAAPIRREDGTVIGSILVLRDITRRREQDLKLLLSEKTFRGTFDRAPIGIAHVATTGRFLRVNGKLCEMVGYTSDEMQTLRIQQITHPEDLAATNEFVDRLHDDSNSTASFEKRLVGKYGEVIWVNVTISLMRNRNNEPAYFVAMIEDIREWRAAEEMRIRMAALVSSSNDAIIGKTFDGIVTSWNPAAEQLFGFTEAEMVGESIFKIVPEEDRNAEQELLNRLETGDTVDQYEALRVRKDGTQVEVALHLSPIKDPTGKRIGISTIARDTTERKKAEASLKESEARFRTLAENMSQLAWMADGDGKVYWYNKRWYDYTGTNFTIMNQRGWKRVYHPDHYERVVAGMQHSWDTGAAWEDTFPVRSKDGTYRWFLSRALPIRNSEGEIETWFGSNTDITELKQYEASLQQARIAAENANHSRGEFLANMSHEIRTPMTAILGHADIMAEHIQDPDNLQCVDIIRRNGKFLLEIINDILDLSKIDAGKFQVERERVHPELILADVRSLMDVRAEERCIEFETRVEGMLPESIETDAVRLRQILLNLVGNAIKFTDRGKVCLSARFVADTNQMQFDVTDTGIGISPENLTRLFLPFMQADASSTRAYEGTGLGLAISRRLAQALGGDISVCSEVGFGSTFAVTIDCGSLENVNFIEPSLIAKEPEQPPHTSTTIDGCILVVDDRRDIRYLAQHFIEKAGGQVVTATNGREAIDILTDPDPQDSLIDLVVIDMQMPVMDGYDAAQELRQRGFTKPIIALTANAMKDDREKCITAGCNDYATKPLDGPKLITMIAQYLSESRVVEAQTTLNDA
jgi:PAS domain S-box-containing protein